MVTPIAWWSGDGKAAGLDLTTSLVGTGDDHFDTVSITAPNTVKTKAGGLYTPRLECIPSTGANMYWLWQASLGSFTDHSLTFYFEIAAYPTPTSMQIFSMRSSANEQLYWTDIKSDGTVRLRNNAGTAVMQSLQPIPLNKVVRFDYVYTHSIGEVWAFMSYGESTRRFEYFYGTNFQIRNSDGATMVPAQARFGSNTIVSQGAAHCYYDDMIFANSIGSTVGPINPDTTSGFYVWNGSSAVGVDIDGKWLGSATDGIGSIDIKR